MQIIWRTFSAYIARAALQARIYIFEFIVQFISRDHIANVDFNDVSVYMENN